MSRKYKFHNKEGVLLVYCNFRGTRRDACASGDKNTGHWEAEDLADVTVTAKGNVNTTFKDIATVISASTYLPQLAIDAMYQRRLNPGTYKISMSEKYAMARARPGFRNAGRIVGGVGLGLSYAQAAVEYKTLGSVRMSTQIDLAISTTLYAGSFMSGPAAPVFWTFGAIYGGTRLMAGDMIDNWIDGN